MRGGAHPRAYDSSEISLELCAAPLDSDMFSNAHWGASWESLYFLQLARTVPICCRGFGASLLVSLHVRCDQLSLQVRGPAQACERVRPTGTAEVGVCSSPQRLLHWSHTCQGLVSFLVRLHVEGHQHGHGRLNARSVGLQHPHIRALSVQSRR